MSKEEEESATEEIELAFLQLIGAFGFPQQLLGIIQERRSQRLEQ